MHSTTDELLDKGLAETSKGPIELGVDFYTIFKPCHLGFDGMLDT